jgi:hypothetical protein
MNHSIERLRQRLRTLSAGPAPAAVPTLSIALTIPLPLAWPLRNLMQEQGGARVPGLRIALGHLGLTQTGVRYGVAEKGSPPPRLPGRMQRLHIPSRARTAAELQRVARMASNAILPPLTLEVRAHRLPARAGLRPAAAVRRPSTVTRPAPRRPEAARSLSLRPWSRALAAQCRRLMHPMHGLALPSISLARKSGSLGGAVPGL